jgi:outer membrane protein assembly factor BamB
MHTRNPAWFCLLCLLVASRLNADSPSAAAGRSSIEGKWLGTAGAPLDPVAVGFEFKRDDKGNLKAYLYEPVGNFYGLELPGEVLSDGNKYLLKEWRLSLTLHDGNLEGTYILPDRPISLSRTDQLPSEVPIPALPQGPGPKWQAKLGAAIYAPAAVRDGTAYVGTSGGIFNAIDVRDGSFIWTFVAGRPMHGEALATDRHVFFVCDNGYLFKLERKNGKEIWRYDLGDERVDRPLVHRILEKQNIGRYDFDHAAPRPLLADGVIYIGSGNGGFHAVDAESGTRIWRFEAKEKIRTNAALFGSQVFFGTFAGFVYALDRQNGKEVWKKDTRAEVTSSPVVIGDRLIVGNRGGFLGALDLATGKTIWRTVLWGSSVESTAVSAENGLFYIGSSDLRRISMMDSKDGRVIWRADVFGVAWPRPLVTDKVVYASTAGVVPYQMRHQGSLSALDRATGKIIWRWPVPDGPALHTGFNAAPVIAGDTVVIGGLDGNLYGFPAA